jgi:ketosteroid isomerase-like protein
MTTVDTLINDWTDAERASDAERMGALLADDFVGIGPVGFVLDKAAWIGRYADLRYQAFAIDEVATHRHGDTAVVVAHQHADGHAGEHRMFPDLRVSMTIVGDRIAGMQYSFIGMPGGPA